MHALAKTALLLAGIAASAGVSTADVIEKVRALADTEFASLGRDPILVAAVKAQNASGRTLDDVKTLDAKWQASAGVADFMRALMDSPAGRHVTAWKQARPYVSEVFVMDDLGANVAQSDKTSDYWQGDEPKFIECFKGNGQIFFGKMAFDESSQTYGIQISVPVIDGDALIGAVCIGVDVEKLVE